MGRKKQLVDDLQHSLDNTRRSILKRLMTGSCKVCTINLYQDKRPQKSTMPCEVAGCPYG